MIKLCVLVDPNTHIIKIYTDAVLRDLFKYQGVGDPFVTNVMLE